MEYITGLPGWGSAHGLSHSSRLRGGGPLHSFIGGICTNYMPECGSSFRILLWGQRAGL